MRPTVARSLLGATHAPRAAFSNVARPRPGRVVRRRDDDSASPRPGDRRLVVPVDASLRAAPRGLVAALARTRASPCSRPPGRPLLCPAGGPRGARGGRRGRAVAPTPRAGRGRGVLGRRRRHPRSRRRPRRSTARSPRWSARSRRSRRAGGRDAPRPSTRLRCERGGERGGSRRRRKLASRGACVSPRARRPRGARGGHDRARDSLRHRRAETVAVEAASLAAERMDARGATLVAASDALEPPASTRRSSRRARRAKLLRDADAVAARTSDLGLAQREVDGAARRFDAAAQAQLAELEAVETAVAEAERLEREAKIAEAKIFDADVASAQCDVSRDEARRGFFAALTSASEARQRAEPRRERYAGSLSRTYATKLALLKARHAERALRAAARGRCRPRRLELDTAAKSLEMARDRRERRGPRRGSGRPGGGGTRAVRGGHRAPRGGERRKAEAKRLEKR